ncbi:hypothetical protein JYT90_01000 [bacterium AH-315-P07]|nr:hypothetical protein [bacterium AH-315-P07]
MSQELKHLKTLEGNNGDLRNQADAVHTDPPASNRSLPLIDRILNNLGVALRLFRTRAPRTVNTPERFRSEEENRDELYSGMRMF